jgi:hypothetical protein
MDNSQCRLSAGRGGVLSPGLGYEERQSIARVSSRGVNAW